MIASALTLGPVVPVLPSAVFDAARENPLSDFSDTPIWLSLVKAVLIFAYLLLSVLIMIWAERRLIGRMQQRPGPNRNGPFGLLQSLADGVKSMLKEDVRPKAADVVVFTAAPIVFAGMAFFAFSIIPMGPDVSMFGHRTPLQLTDLPVAVLLVLAAAGVAAYGVIMAGWSSGSTYPLLGGLRSSAQIISYEIAMGLSLVAVFLYAGSMSTSQIVAAQAEQGWFIIAAAFSFVVYIITMVGETNRLPFDLAEGEGEIVGGYFTEYSGMRFAMFFLAEYINMFTVSAIATTLFLGGWQAPPGIAAIGDGMFNQGWWGLLWFTVKMWIFMFGFIWLRGSLPRTRYDQFMKFGWKFLIPASLVWIVLVALVRGAGAGFFGESTFTVLGRSYPYAVLFVLGIFLLLFIGAFMLQGYLADRREAANTVETPAEVDPFAGGFPVPPLPGQRLLEPALAHTTDTVPDGDGEPVVITGKEN
ncbi:MAG: NADH-quinone oxidoreductase subunit NuoH [Actinomycetales bacterium]|nr:NADH-quinone oxidoreductase subunit NuoH [Tetrasphaera sp.]NLX00804.1 NADH-quinone oxidoreductase subunit NuoH [Actinomycetales bacterium]